MTTEQRKLFFLGRKVAENLPLDASILRPSTHQLKIAATTLGISERQARAALDRYNQY
jgi:hypothetical protein